MKILAMTVACVDLYEQLSERYIGGNSINFLSRAKLMCDHQLSFLGRVGNDSNGNMIVEYLNKQNCDLTNFRQIEGITANNTMLVDKNGERYSKDNSWNGGVYETFILTEDEWEYVNQHDLIVLSASDPNFQTAFTKIDKNVKIVVDFLHSTDFQFLNLFHRFRNKCDIAFINGTEEIINEVIDIGVEKEKVVVVSMNEKGSAAITSNGIFRQEALPVEKVIDTTGCGDNFLSAFTLSYLKYLNIADALKAGAEAGKETLGYYGGIARENM